MPATEMDAIELMEQDHQEVEALLQQYEAADDGATKEDLAEEICAALTVHASIEEEIFYPAVARQVEGAEGLVEEARKEHASVKQLINDISSADAADSTLDSLVKDLGINVKHHVQEEEGEMFPKVRERGLDLKELGRRMSARKSELMGEESVE
jgi:hemerythrin superfamily protein